MDELALDRTAWGRCSEAFVARCTPRYRQPLHKLPSERWPPRPRHSSRGVPAKNEHRWHHLSEQDRTEPTRDGCVPESSHEIGMVESRLAWFLCKGGTHTNREEYMC